MSGRGERGVDVGTTDAAAGVHRLPGAAPPDLRRAMIAEADRLTFTAPHPQAGGWFARSDLDAGGATSVAARWLMALAAGRGFAFAPTEASYQRYKPGGNGLPPHRDQRYYVECIAIVTVTGEATFAVHGSRDIDDVVTAWTTTPGDVVLLPGWAPGAIDPRPWHRVDPPVGGPRLMFQLRRLAPVDTERWPVELTDVERDQARELAALPPAAPRPA